MASPESAGIRSYLLTLKNAPPAPLPEQRAALDTLVETYVGHPLPLPTGTQVEKVVVNGIAGEWVSSPDADPQRVLLYLHGGAYIMGSCDSHRELVARICAASGVRTLLIEYRLAPEHVFPAALEDALAAYRWLLANGTRPEHIIVGGDSAGGGLALSLLTVLRDKGEPLPAGAVLLSPWTDVAGTGASMTTNAEADPWISAAAFNFVASLYAGAEDVHHPQISPVYADLHGLPPLLIHVGSDEVLLNDSTRVDEQVKAVGGTVQLSIWEGMWHVFQVFACQLPEGQQAIKQIGEFIRRQTAMTQAATLPDSR